MYSLEQFANMFSDPLRMDAYRGAISAYVKPGSVVLDLGCGPGVFALLACKAGARRVYAIDVDNIVDFGRHLAAANGVADRVQFLCGDSRQIQLPERADVIISDVRGSLPLHSHAIGTLEDARVRFLAAGGRLLPASDTLICAVVETSQLYGDIVDAWRAVPGLDLSLGLPMALNNGYYAKFEPGQLISDSQRWLKLEYMNGPQSRAAATLQMTVTRDSIGHGIGLWFETELGNGFGYSTAPGNGDRVYGHRFLPWLEPVPLREGDVCQVNLDAHLVCGNYIWQWELRRPASEGRAEVHFRQSTFHGSVFSPSYLKKHASDYVPVLSEAGLAQQWLLQNMDGQRSLEQISSAAAEMFPRVFRRVEDAYSRAAEIAEKFSR